MRRRDGGTASVGEAREPQCTGSVPAVVSVQSQVAFGHVGNSAAIFPLQRLGVNVWPVPTTLLSNHPRYASCRGRPISGRQVAGLFRGLLEREVFRDADLLSGYLATPAAARCVVAALTQARREQRAGLRYVCDPVIGDRDVGRFVHPGLPALIARRLLPLADLITPNHYELETLSGAQVRTEAEAIAAARRLLSRHGRDQGGRLSAVIITSLQVAETPAEALDVLAVLPTRAWRVRLPWLPVAVMGPGDLFCAVLTARWLLCGDLRAAFGAACDTTHGLLAESLRHGLTELPLIAAQDRLVQPTDTFAKAMLEL